MNAIKKWILSIVKMAVGVVVFLVALTLVFKFFGVFEILKNSRRSDIEHAIITAWGDSEKFCRLNGRPPTEFSDRRIIKVTPSQYVNDIQQQSASEFLKEQVFLLTISALDPKDNSNNLDGYGAYMADYKMDDGLPNSGKMRFIGQPACLTKSDKGDVTYNKDYKDYEADCTAFTIEINCEKKAK